MGSRALRAHKAPPIAARRLVWAPSAEQAPVERGAGAVPSVTLTC